MTVSGAQFPVTAGEWGVAFTAQVMLTMCVCTQGSLVQQATTHLVLSGSHTDSHLFEECQPIQC